MGRGRLSVCLCLALSAQPGTPRPTPSRAPTVKSVPHIPPSPPPLQGLTHCPHGNQTEGEEVSAWPPHQPCPASQEGSEPGGFGFTGSAPARAAWAWWGDASLRPPTGSRGKATCAQGLRCLYRGPPAVQTLSKEAPLLGSFSGCTAVGVHGLLALPVCSASVEPPWGSGARAHRRGPAWTKHPCCTASLSGGPVWPKLLGLPCPPASSAHPGPWVPGVGQQRPGPARGRRDHGEGVRAEDRPGRGTYTGNGTDRIPRCHTGTPFLWPGPPCPCRPAD